MRTVGAGAGVIPHHVILRTIRLHAAFVPASREAEDALEAALVAAHRQDPAAAALSLASVVSLTDDRRAFGLMVQFMLIARHAGLWTVEGDDVVARHMLRIMEVAS